MPVPATSIPAKFLESARQLYTLPGVAVRLLELMRAPEVDVRELQACIGGDPALVSKLLRVVNSSLFSLTKPVADLSQAIALLGMQRLKMLVLGFSLPAPSSTGIQPTVLERYWRHTVLKAVGARELAEALWRIPGDEAFVAGLLQDIGLLALVQDLGDSYVKFLHGVWSVGNEPREMEMEVLGFDHVQLSTKLLEEWGLPEPLLAAISAPYDAAKLSELTASERRLPQILTLAELLTRFLMYREMRWLDELLATGEACRGMTIEQLHEILLSLEQKAPQFAETLSLPFKDEGKYVALLKEARHRQKEALRSVSANHLMPCNPRPADVLRGLQEHCPPVIQSVVRATADRNHPESGGVAALRGNGIATHPLQQCLASAIANCRSARTPISLAIVQLDNCETVRIRFGVHRMQDVMNGVKSLVRSAVDRDDQLEIAPVSDTRVAAIFSGLDRHQAMSASRQILDRIRRFSEKNGHAGVHLSVSIGLASLPVPSRNFPVMDLVSAAERCLHGVQLSGGDGLKSIEIC